MDELIKKMWYAYAMEQYQQQKGKKKRILPFATTWEKL